MTSFPFQSMWCLPVLLSGLLPQLVSAETMSLSLEDALHGALNRPGITRQFDALRSEGDSLEHIASRLPNPSFSFEQEVLSGNSTDATERAYRLSQTFDFSGERSLRRKAAAAASRALKSEVGVRSHDIRDEVRKYYFDALYAQQRLQLLSDWTARIARLVEQLRFQVERGESSRYDFQRLEQTRLAFVAEQTRSQSEKIRQQARLLVLVDLPVGTEIILTEQLTPPPGPDLNVLQAAVDSHPELNRLAALRDEAQLTSSAERRAAMPDPDISFGVKTITRSGPDEEGYMFGFSVPLPLFDRRKGQAGLAAARAADHNAAYQLIRKEHLINMQADLAAYNVMHDRLLEQTEAAKQSAQELVIAAEAGYAGAEQSVLELADAYEVALATHLDVLSLTYETRNAHSEIVTHLHGEHEHD